MSITVADYLKNISQTTITCATGQTIQEAAKAMRAHHIGAMPVVDEAGKLLGILSERDIVGALAADPAQIPKLTVGDLMIKDVIACPPTATMQRAMNLMNQHRVRHLPVTEKGVVIGNLSIRDALSVLLKDLKLEADVLRDVAIASRAR